MSALDDLLDWCRREQARLERDLDLMERGILTTGEQQSGSPSGIQLRRVWIIFVARLRR
jgi:hypothetical protein